MMPISRRGVVCGLTSAAMCGVAGTLASPLLIGRDEAEVTPGLMKFRPEIEPLVALFERTPRERCAEMLVDQLRQGVSYRQLMAALFLAGIRNVNPRPPGFALHCVFVIHSAHIISLEAPADSRLLPLFYALDNFKSAQERDARQASGDYTMRPIAGSFPPPQPAETEFTAAMEAWDPERAERATVSLVRDCGAGQVFEMLWPTERATTATLGTKRSMSPTPIGRSTLSVGSMPSPCSVRWFSPFSISVNNKTSTGMHSTTSVTAATSNLKETLPRLDDGWMSEEADPTVTRSLLGVMRESTAEEACAEVAGRFAKGKTTAGTVWDAVHLSAAELRMRARSGAAIVGVHAVTAVNALHHAYLVMSEPQDRLLLLLQAVVGWVSFGNGLKHAKRACGNFRSTTSSPALRSSPPIGPHRDFRRRSIKSRCCGCRRLRLARDVPARQTFLASALRLTVTKANEVHYYRYLAAVIEEFPLVSPDWQPHLLAAAVYYMKGTSDPEPATMKRAREALRALAV